MGDYNINSTDVNKTSNESTSAMITRLENLRKDLTQLRKQEYAEKLKKEINPKIHSTNNMYPTNINSPKTNPPLNQGELFMKITETEGKIVVLSNEIENREKKTNKDLNSLKNEIDEKFQIHGLTIEKENRTIKKPETEKADPSIKEDTTIENLGDQMKKAKDAKPEGFDDKG